MAQPCSICSHAQRMDIEAALVNRHSLRHIAAQFGVSVSAIRRHKEKCLAGQVAVIHAEQDEQALHTVADKLRWMWQETTGLYQQAKSAQDAKEQRCTMAELRQQVSLEAELAAPTVEDDLAPVLELVFRILSPYPEARAELAAELAKLGGGYDALLPAAAVSAPA